LLYNSHLFLLGWIHSFREGAIDQSEWEWNNIMEAEGSEDDQHIFLHPRPVRPWRVAVIANVKGETALTQFSSKDAPGDAGVDSFENPETIEAICQIIAAEGHTAAFFQAGPGLPAALCEFSPDICFNIAEGVSGDAREAQVPALLEMLNIPYTGSRVLTNAIALDKTMTKRVWRDNGLPTGAFQEFTQPDQRLQEDLQFPLFVKPAREGSSMGISSRSIVQDERDLRRQVDWVIRSYKEPALVEEYLSGREFTVAVLGRPDARLASFQPSRYREDGFFRFVVQEIVTDGSVTPSVYSLDLKKLDYDEPGSARFLLPAPISDELALELHRLAIRAHLAIGALDISRVDLRMNRFGKPCLMEINTLPGLVPGFSDLFTISEKSGLSYNDLILEILYLGASRYGLLASQPGVPVAVTKNASITVR
jgi:D-alanine-D-alanine ligase